MASNNSRQLSILIVNPNTSTHMTDALKPILESLRYSDVHFDYFTAPSGESVTLHGEKTIQSIPSINSGEDSALSALHCRPFVEPLVPRYDGFLVACYSAHPLVGILKNAIQSYEEAHPTAPRKYVTGIFEASVLASLSLISAFQLGSGLDKAPARDTFGIVSTGSIWETELSRAVTDMLLNPGEKANGASSSARFAGVATTGLTAVELHTTSAEEVRRRISDATEQLLRSSSDPVGAVCLGCAGMAGMEEAVREGCIRAYGKQLGSRVRIVDGVMAGAGILVAACKAGF